MQPTSGPWTYETAYYGLGYQPEPLFCVKGPDIPVEWAWGGSISNYIAHQVTAANARLIAAAPDLLAALEALLWQHDHNAGQLCGMALQDARAAIAKAKEEV